MPSPAIRRTPQRLALCLAAIFASLAATGRTALAQPGNAGPQVAIRFSPEVLQELQAYKGQNISCDQCTTMMGVGGAVWVAEVTSTAIQVRPQPDRRPPLPNIELWIQASDVAAVFINHDTHVLTLRLRG